MTPEQRAARLYDWEGATFSKNDIAIIARAIRAAENAAYERAAECCPPNWIGPGGNQAAALIRSLRTRAPRAKRRNEG